jgi:hypothetical protein
MPHLRRITLTLSVAALLPLPTASAAMAGITLNALDWRRGRQAFEGSPTSSVTGAAHLLDTPTAWPEGPPYAQTGDDARRGLGDRRSRPWPPRER